MRQRLHEHEARPQAEWAIVAAASVVLHCAAAHAAAAAAAAGSAAAAEEKAGVRVTDWDETLSGVGRSFLRYGMQRVPQPGLHEAVQRGLLAVVRELVKGLNMKEYEQPQRMRERSGWSETPLMVAAQAYHLPAARQLQLVRELLRAGSNPLATDDQGRTPLTLCLLAAPRDVHTASLCAGSLPPAHVFFPKNSSVLVRLPHLPFLFVSGVVIDAFVPNAAGAVAVAHTVRIRNGVGGGGAAAAAADTSAPLIVPPDRVVRGVCAADMIPFDDGEIAVAAAGGGGGSEGDCGSAEGVLLADEVLHRVRLIPRGAPTAAAAFDCWVEARVLDTMLGACTVQITAPEAVSVSLLYLPHPGDSAAAAGGGLPQVPFQIPRVIRGVPLAALRRRSGVGGGEQAPAAGGASAVPPAIAASVRAVPVRAAVRSSTNLLDPGRAGGGHAVRATEGVLHTGREVLYVTEAGGGRGCESVFRRGLVHCRSLEQHGCFDVVALPALPALERACRDNVRRAVVASAAAERRGGGGRLRFCGPPPPPPAQESRLFYLQTLRHVPPLRPRSGNVGGGGGGGGGGAAALRAFTLPELLAMPAELPLVASLFEGDDALQAAAARCRARLTLRCSGGVPHYNEEQRVWRLLSKALGGRGEGQRLVGMKGPFPVDGGDGEGCLCDETLLEDYVDGCLPVPGALHDEAAVLARELASGSDDFPEVAAVVRPERHRSPAGLECAICGRAFDSAARGRRGSGGVGASASAPWLAATATTATATGSSAPLPPLARARSRSGAPTKRHEDALAASEDVYRGDLIGGGSVRSGGDPSARSTGGASLRSGHHKRHRRGSAAAAAGSASQAPRPLKYLALLVRSGGGGGAAQKTPSLHAAAAGHLKKGQQGSAHGGGGEEESGPLQIVTVPLARLFLPERARVRNVNRSAKVAGVVVDYQVTWRNQLTAAAPSLADGRCGSTRDQVRMSLVSIGIDPDSGGLEGRRGTAHERRRNMFEGSGGGGGGGGTGAPTPLTDEQKRRVQTLCERVARQFDVQLTEALYVASKMDDRAAMQTIRCAVGSAEHSSPGLPLSPPPPPPGAPTAAAPAAATALPVSAREGPYAAALSACTSPYVLHFLMTSLRCGRAQEPPPASPPAAAATAAAALSASAELALPLPLARIASLYTVSEHGAFVAALTDALSAFESSITGSAPAAAHASGVDDAPSPPADPPTTESTRQRRRPTFAVPEAAAAAASTEETSEDGARRRRRVLRQVYATFSEVFPAQRGLDVMAWLARLGCMEGLEAAVASLDRLLCWCGGDARGSHRTHQLLGLFGTSLFFRNTRRLLSGRTASALRVFFRKHGLLDASNKDCRRVLGRSLYLSIVESDWPSAEFFLQTLERRGNGVSDECLLLDGGGGGHEAIESFSEGLAASAVDCQEDDGAVLLSLAPTFKLFDKLFFRESLEALVDQYAEETQRAKEGRMLRRRWQRQQLRGAAAAGGSGGSCGGGSDSSTDSDDSDVEADEGLRRAHSELVHTHYSLRVSQGSGGSGGGGGGFGGNGCPPSPRDPSGLYPSWSTIVLWVQDRRLRPRHIVAKIVAAETEQAAYTARRTAAAASRAAAAAATPAYDDDDEHAAYTRGLLSRAGAARRGRAFSAEGETTAAVSLRDESLSWWVVLRLFKAVGASVDGPPSKCLLNPDWNSVGSDGETALSLAVRDEKNELVRFLLCVDAVDPFLDGGPDVLAIAARHNATPHILVALLHRLEQRAGDGGGKGSVGDRASALAQPYASAAHGALQRPSPKAFYVVLRSLRGACEREGVCVVDAVLDMQHNGVPAFDAALANGWLTEEATKELLAAGGPYGGCGTRLRTHRLVPLLHCLVLHDNRVLFELLLRSSDDAKTLALQQVPLRALPRCVSEAWRRGARCGVPAAVAGSAAACAGDEDGEEEEEALSVVDGIIRAPDATDFLRRLLERMPDEASARTTLRDAMVRACTEGRRDVVEKLRELAGAWGGGGGGGGGRSSSSSSSSSRFVIKALAAPVHDDRIVHRLLTDFGFEANAAELARDGRHDLLVQALEADTAAGRSARLRRPSSGALHRTPLEWLSSGRYYPFDEDLLSLLLKGAAPAVRREEVGGGGGGDGGARHAWIRGTVRLLGEPGEEGLPSCFTADEWSGLVCFTPLLPPWLRVRRAAATARRLRHRAGRGGAARSRLLAPALFASVMHVSDVSFVHQPPPEVSGGGGGGTGGWGAPLPSPVSRHTRLAERMLRDFKSGRSAGRTYAERHRVQRGADAVDGRPHIVSPGGGTDAEEAAPESGGDHEGSVVLVRTDGGGRALRGVDAFEEARITSIGAAGTEVQVYSDAGGRRTVPAAAVLFTARYARMSTEEAFLAVVRLCGVRDAASARVVPADAHLRFARSHQPYHRSETVKITSEFPPSDTSFSLVELAAVESGPQMCSFLAACADDGDAVAASEEDGESAYLRAMYRCVSIACMLCARATLDGCLERILRRLRPAPGGGGVLLVNDDLFERGNAKLAAWVRSPVAARSLVAFLRRVGGPPIRERRNRLDYFNVGVCAASGWIDVLRDVSNVAADLRNERLRDVRGLGPLHLAAEAGACGAFAFLLQEAAAWLRHTAQERLAAAHEWLREELRREGVGGPGGRSPYEEELCLQTIGDWARTQRQLGDDWPRQEDAGRGDTGAGCGPGEAAAAAGSGEDLEERTHAWIRRKVSAWTKANRTASIFDLLKGSRSVLWCVARVSDHAAALEMATELIATILAHAGTEELEKEVKESKALCACLAQDVPSYDMVDLLLRHGAEPNETDGGKSALQHVRGADGGAGAPAAAARDRCARRIVEELVFWTVEVMEGGGEHVGQRFDVILFDAKANRYKVRDSRAADDAVHHWFAASDVADFKGEAASGRFLHDDFLHVADAMLPEASTALMSFRVLKRYVVQSQPHVNVHTIRVALHHCLGRLREHWRLLEADSLKADDASAPQAPPEWLQFRRLLRVLYEVHDPSAHDKDEVNDGLSLSFQQALTDLLGEEHTRLLQALPLAMFREAVANKEAPFMTQVFAPHQARLRQQLCEAWFNATFATSLLGRAAPSLPPRAAVAASSLGQQPPAPAVPRFDAEFAMFQTLHECGSWDTGYGTSLEMAAASGWHRAVRWLLAQKRVCPDYSHSKDAPVAAVARRVERLARLIKGRVLQAFWELRLGRYEPEEFVHLVRLSNNDEPAYRVPSSLSDAVLGICRRCMPVRNLLQVANLLFAFGTDVSPGDLDRLGIVLRLDTVFNAQLRTRHRGVQGLFVERCTLLHLAAANSNAKTVAFLLGHDRYQDTVGGAVMEDASGRTARHYTTSHECHQLLAHRELQKQRTGYVPPVDHISLVIAIRLPESLGMMPAAVARAKNKVAGALAKTSGKAEEEDRVVLGEGMCLQALAALDLGGFVIERKRQGRETDDCVFVAVSSSAPRMQLTAMRYPHLVQSDRFQSTNQHIDDSEELNKHFYRAGGLRDESDEESDGDCEYHGSAAAGATNYSALYSSAALRRHQAEMCYMSLYADQYKLRTHEAYTVTKYLAGLHTWAVADSHVQAAVTAVIDAVGRATFDAADGERAAQFEHDARFVSDGLWQDYGHPVTYPERVEVQPSSSAQDEAIRLCGVYVLQTGKTSGGSGGEEAGFRAAKEYGESDSLEVVWLKDHKESRTYEERCGGRDGHGLDETRLVLHDGQWSITHRSSPAYEFPVGGAADASSRSSVGSLGASGAAAAAPIAFTYRRKAADGRPLRAVELPVGEEDWELDGGSDDDEAADSGDDEATVDSTAATTPDNSPAASAAVGQQRGGGRGGQVGRPYQGAWEQRGGGGGPRSNPIDIRDWRPAEDSSHAPPSSVPRGSVSHTEVQPLIRGGGGGGARVGVRQRLRRRLGKEKPGPPPRSGCLLKRLKLSVVKTDGGTTNDIWKQAVAEAAAGDHTKWEVVDRCRDAVYALMQDRAPEAGRPSLVMSKRLEKLITSLPDGTPQVCELTSPKFGDIEGTYEREPVSDYLGWSWKKTTNPRIKLTGTCTKQDSAEAASAVSAGATAELTRIVASAAAPSGAAGSAGGGDAASAKKHAKGDSGGTGDDKFLTVWRIECDGRPVLEMTGRSTPPWHVAGQARWVNVATQTAVPDIECTWRAPCGGGLADDPALCAELLRRKVGAMHGFRQLKLAAGVHVDDLPFRHSQGLPEDRLAAYHPPNFDQEGFVPPGQKWLEILQRSKRIVKVFAVHSADEARELQEAWQPHLSHLRELFTQFLIFKPHLWQPFSSIVEFLREKDIDKEEERDCSTIEKYDPVTCRIVSRVKFLALQPPDQHTSVDWQCLQLLHTAAVHTPLFHERCDRYFAEDRVDEVAFLQSLASPPADVMRRSDKFILGPTTQYWGTVFKPAYEWWLPVWVDGVEVLTQESSIKQDVVASAGGGGGAGASGGGEREVQCVFKALRTVPYFKQTRWGRVLERQAKPLLKGETIVVQYLSFDGRWALVRHHDNAAYFRRYTMPMKCPDGQSKTVEPTYLSQLTKVERYFGSKTAFYFAYTAMYCSYLLGLFATGVLFTIVQVAGGLYRSQKVVIWNAIVVIAWAAVFIRRWMRKASELAHLWGVRNVEYWEAPMAEYMKKNSHRGTRLNKLTGIEEPHIPTRERLLKYSATVLAVAFMVAVVCFIMWFNVDLRDTYTKQKSGAGNFWKIAFGMQNALCVAVLDGCFSLVADSLNSFENHRTKSSLQRSAIFKSFTFRFVNGFSGMIITVFKRPKGVCHFCSSACDVACSGAVPVLATAHAALACPTEDELEQCVTYIRQRDLMVQLTTMLIVQSLLSLVCEKLLPVLSLRMQLRVEELRRRRSELTFPKRLASLVLDEVDPTCELYGRIHVYGDGPLKGVYVLPLNEDCDVCTTDNCGGVFSVEDVAEREEHEQEECEEDAQDEAAEKAYRSPRPVCSCGVTHAPRVYACGGGGGGGGDAPFDAGFAAGREQEWQYSVVYLVSRLHLSRRRRRRGGGGGGWEPLGWFALQPAGATRIGGHPTYCESDRWLGDDGDSSDNGGFQVFYNTSSPAARCEFDVIRWYRTQGDGSVAATQRLYLRKSPTEVLRLVRTEEHVAGAASPASPITLSEDACAAHKIPKAARTFLYLYNTSISVAARDDTQPSNLWRMLSFGGYLYDSADGAHLSLKCIQPKSDGGGGQISRESSEEQTPDQMARQLWEARVNLLRDQGFSNTLEFNEAVPWPDAVTRPLWDAGRYQRVTVDVFTKTGAQYYCWIIPGEELRSATVGKPAWRASDSGVFAYLFVEPSEREHVDAEPGHIPPNPPRPNPKNCFFSIARRQNDGKTLVLTESLKPSVTEEKEFDDYTMMMLHFAYVVCFASVLPLAPLVALVTGTIELHSDLYKFLHILQRVEAEKASGIGAWLFLLKSILLISVVINVLIAFQGYGWRAYSTSTFDKVTGYFLCVCLGTLLVFVISFVISDTATWVRDRELRRVYELTQEGAADKTRAKKGDRSPDS